MVLELDGPWAMGERGAPMLGRPGRELSLVKNQPDAPWAGLGHGLWRGSEGGEIEISLGAGRTEVVDIDQQRGPKLLQENGEVAFLNGGRRWGEIPTVDQKVLAFQAAKHNHSLKESLGDGFLRAMSLARAVRDAPHDRIGARCRSELARAPVPWAPISIEQVREKHEQRAPGILYGLDFPWDAKLLKEFGPEWLTKAFHAAGSLDRSNRVTRLEIEEKIVITGGNNAGKFLFQVEYAQAAPDLHTQLFAKVPYAMTKETSADRFSSSVYKQPMDLYEINTYRLLEAGLPVKTPKFYYGDISNETSNFILITEQIPFACFKELREGPSRAAAAPLEPGALAPGEVEGPYDKCKDWQLQGEAKEYYRLLIAALAKIAGGHKAGRLGSEEVLSKNLGSLPVSVSDWKLWGMNTERPTGEDPATYRRKVDTAVKFFSETARALYPDYVQTESFKTKFTNVMMTWSAYQAELTYWKMHDLDYVAIGHQNLNADNAYYWREESGELACGVFDWGGMGMSHLGHKMWWTFNCADFDQVKDNLDEYIDLAVSSYRELGGPALDREVMRLAILITSLENTSFMSAAVPNCFKMCALGEWATIADRADPRVSENVDGKSTLRTTIHVMGNGLRALEELKSDELLEKWIQEIYVKRWGYKAKTRKMIFGA